jgi:hypothetical protein
MNNECTLPAAEEDLWRESLRTGTLRADIIKVAERVAATGDMLAETLRGLASRHPREASRLRAKIEAAESNAERARRLAGNLEAGRTLSDNNPDAMAT